MTIFIDGVTPPPECSSSFVRAMNDMNNKYAAIVTGNTTRVLFVEQRNDDGTLQLLQKGAFFDFLANQKLDITIDGPKNSKKIVKAPIAQLWWESPYRKTYPKGFVFDPKETPHGAFNLWSGWGVEPRAGSWERCRRMITDDLCSGDEAHADYVVRWLAWAVQNPVTPARVALVLQGDEGTGKGMLASFVEAMFGDHYIRIHSMDHLVGRFNAHLHNKSFLFVDEAALVEQKKEGSIKSLISETTLPVERKGIDLVNTKNCLHVMLASNNARVIPAGPGARRYAVFKTSSAHKANADYWDAIETERENGGAAAMLHDLLAMDLTGWHPERKRPDTAALAEQKVGSLGPLDAAWLGCLELGDFNGLGLPMKNGRALIVPRMVAEYVSRTRTVCGVSLPEVTRFFESMGFVYKEARTAEQGPNNKARGYVVELDAARAAWCKRQGSAHVWVDAVAEDDATPTEGEIPF